MELISMQACIDATFGTVEDQVVSILRPDPERTQAILEAAKATVPATDLHVDRDPLRADWSWVPLCCENDGDEPDECAR